MSTAITTPTASWLVDDIVDVLVEIGSTDGIPEATRHTCDHSLDAMHGAMHGLSLWLHELLEWAPLRPETRANVARLAGILDDAEAGFHDAIGHDRWSFGSPNRRTRAVA